MKFEFLFSTLNKDVKSQKDRDTIQMKIYEQIPDKSFLNGVPREDRFKATLDKYFDLIE